jgi:glucokinase
MTGTVLAIDVGGTRIKAALVQDRSILAFTVLATADRRGAEGLLDTLLRLGRTLVSEGPVDAVGVCLKGIVDPRTGTVGAVNESLTDLVDVPLATIFTDEFGCPTFVENDARMYALGELVHGAGQGCENMVCVTVGTGVGTSVAISRRIVRGQRGVLGILAGHMTIDLDGPRCTCGNHGCLEAFVGATALAMRAERALAAGRRSVLRPGDVDPQRLFEAADRGDELASEVVRDFNRRLGAGVVSMIHAYDPDIVILGGGIMQAGPQIVGPVQSYVDARAWTIPRGRVRIAPAALGDQAALFGVAELAVRGHAFL